MDGLVMTYVCYSSKNVDQMHFQFHISIYVIDYWDHFLCGSSDYKFKK